MNKSELDKKLALACIKDDHNLDEIKELILAGANTNQLNEYGYNIFDSVFFEALNECENVKEAPVIVEKIKEIIPIMIDKGWDVKRFGIKIIDNLFFLPYDTLTFELYRFMLQYDLTDDPKEYEKVLEGIGTEESYQRCCGNDHDSENVFYAMYEMVKAKKNGQDYTSIDPYYNAVGMTIDKIIYFSDTNTLSEKKNFTEYNADIGFVCADKLLVVRNMVNILFVNDRITEQPQIDISEVFGKDVINKKIKNISFDHKEIVKGTAYYGQPIIIIELENGKKIKFTHNFGEVPKEKFQAHFLIE